MVKQYRCTNVHKMYKYLLIVLFLSIPPPWKSFQSFIILPGVVGQSINNRHQHDWRYGESIGELKKKHQASKNTIKQFRGRFPDSDSFDFVSEQQQHQQQQPQRAKSESSLINSWRDKDAVTSFLAKSSINHEDNIAIKGITGKYSVLSIEDEEALVMQHTIYKLLKMLEISIRMSSSLIRISGDTTAGLVSGIMKGFGGLIDLIASLFSKFSQNLSNKSAILMANNGTASVGGAHLVFSTKVNHLQEKISSTLKSSVKLLNALSQTCIWSGEITESLTSGLGEALQDSFRGLELLSASSHKVVHYLLDVNSTFSHSVKPIKYAKIHSFTTSTTKKTKMSIDRLPNANLPFLQTDENVDNTMEDGDGAFRIDKTVDDISGQDNYQSISSKLRLQKSQMKERSHSLFMKDPMVTTDQQYDTQHQHQQQQQSPLRSDSNIPRKEETSQQSLSSIIFCGIYNNTIFRHALDAFSRWKNNSVSSPLNRSSIQVNINQTENEVKRDTLYQGTDDYNNFRKDYYNALIATSLEIVLGARLMNIILSYWESIYGIASFFGNYLILVSFDLWPSCLWFGSICDDFGAPAMEIQLMACLVILCITVSGLVNRKFHGKLLLLIAILIFSYSFIITLESTYRKKLVQRTKIQAVDEFIREKSMKTMEYQVFTSNSTNYSQTDEEELHLHSSYQGSIGTYYQPHSISSTNSAKLSKNSTLITTKSHLQLYTTAVSVESISWFNSMFGALWTVYDDFLNGGGLGLYMNEVYEEMLSTELAAIPPKVANLRLKRFDIGSNPPTFKSLHTHIQRNNSCLGSLLKRNNVDIDEIRLDTSHAKVRSHKDRHKNNPFGTSEDQRKHTHQQTSLSPKNGIRSVVDTILYRLTDILQSALLDGYENSRNHQAIKSDLLRYFYVSCDTLILEIDLLFISKDMDIILSLRSSELKSALPEIQLKVSEVVFEGVVRFEILLTPDFPFVGNATMFFPTVPSLDFTINSFGGLDLSSIPLAFHFVNSSMFWIMEQYTYPMFTTLDLRHTLCTTCDAAPVPTIPEVLIDSSLSFGRKLKSTIFGFKQKVQTIVAKAKSFVFAWKAKFDNFKSSFKQSSVPKKLEIVL